RPIEGVTGELIADAARAAGATVRYHEDLDSLEAALRDDVARGDVVITMGAGDIDRVARGLWTWLNDRGETYAPDEPAARRPA
ncbi:MAG TPA: UDP-N-acetylmuramate--L-alanine ligase, partial [Thermoanaerobaculia bacterium]